MKRDFDNWFSNFRNTLATYDYYVDFKKVINNVDKVKVELNILNTLIGSKNIESDFENIVREYPQVLKCIPILIACRAYEIYILDGDMTYIYNFKKQNYSIEKYKEFMRKTGLFGMLENHLISSLVDYTYGVEAGLDSNARKNRTGDSMETLVETFIQNAGFVKDISYFTQMFASTIREKWNIDIPDFKVDDADKKIDFVVKTKNSIYGIEVNFYSSGGSKLNETARSYKQIALETANIPGFIFVWITDGHGWKKAKNNLRETFNVLDNIYSIHDLESGLITTLFK